MKLNKILAVIIMTICSLAAAAQEQIYVLHPVLGDTIDRNEVEKYYLFKDYTLDSVDYFILYKNKEFFTLIGMSDNATVVNRKLSNEEVLLKKEQVEKLNNYYISELKKDSSKLDFNKDQQLNSNSSKVDINLNIKTPEFQKSVKKDIRRKYWREQREQVRLYRKNGLYF